MKLDPDAQGQADLAGLGTQLSLQSGLREQMPLLFPEDESIHPLECPGAAADLPIGWTEDVPRQNRELYVLLLVSYFSRTLMTQQKDKYGIRGNR